MGITNCPSCGGYYPNHSLTCPLQERNTGPGGNPLPLLIAPFVLMAVPFIVVVFPIASILAILAAMGINSVLGQVMQETSAFWLTFLISLIPFLAALNAEHWAERFRLYVIPRHILRVIGVPWLAGQYFIYLPSFMAPPHRVASYTFFQLIGQILARPWVVGAMVALAVLAHLVGCSFDLSGRRPATWRQFFRPRFRATLPAPMRGPGSLPSASPPRSLGRKLAISTGLAFGVGVVDTILATDYDSVVMVIVRVGILCTVLFGLVVLGHHALTRKVSDPIARRRPR